MKVGTRKLSLVGLRTFCTVARCGSFRAAAEELYVTASAVSHRIKSLEEELGSELVERHDRSLLLTETGRMFFGDLAPLLEQIDGSADRVRYHGLRASLRISAQPFFASEMLVPALERFTADHPHVDITVDSSEDSAEKHPSGIDISIRLCRKPPEQFDFDALFALRYVPACSPEFRARYLANGSKSAFPVIVHARRADAWDKWRSTHGEGIPEPASVINLDSMIAVARAAQRGLGVALVPLPVSARWFDDESLVQMFEEDLKTQDSYYLISQGELPPAANDFRQWLLQNFVQHS